MGLNTLNSGAISFKKLSGKAHTNQNFAVSEEGITTSVQSSYSTVFGQPITPLPVTNSGFTSLYSTNGIVERVKFQIDIIPNTQIAVGQSQGYRLKLPSDYSTHPGKLYPKFTGGTYLNTALGKLQVVPSLYGKLKPDGSTEYDPILYKQDGSTVISKFDPINWYFDPYSGILFVQDPPAGFDSSANRPGYLEAFLYVGKYLDSVVTGTTSGGTTGATVTASNGLTKVGNDIRLGGVLNGYTNIDLVGNNLQIVSSSFPSFDFSIGNDTFTVGVAHGGVIQLDPTQLTLTAPTGASVSIQTSNPTTNLSNQIQIAPNIYDLFISNSLTNDAFEFSASPGSFSINPYTNGGASLANINFGSYELTVNSQADNDAETLLLVANGALGKLTSIILGTQAGNFMITDARTGLTRTGIEYAANYGTGFTSRSLVDKGWVLGQITGGSVTAGNGLTKIGNNIQLGGTVSASTQITITGSSTSLFLFAEDNPNSLNNYADIYLVSNIVSLTAGSVSPNISSQLQIRDNATTLNVSSGATIFSNISVDNRTIVFSGVSGSQNVGIGLSNQANGLFIRDNRTGSTRTGIVYSANYATGFTSRSLVDKGWVLSQITGSTGSSVTASNGLTKTGSNIRLGGSLTGNTLISASSHDLNLGFTTGKFQITGGTYKFFVDTNNQRVLAGSNCQVTGGSTNYTFGDSNINAGSFGSVTFGEASEITAVVGDGMVCGEGSYVNAYGGKSFARGGAVRASGDYSLIGGGWIPGFANGKTNLKVPQTNAFATFGWYSTDGSQINNHGVNGAYSAIIGGTNHNIPSNTTSSVILGGDQIKAESGVTNTVFFPKVRIGKGNNAAIVTNNLNNDILVRNSATGEIEIRDAVTLISGMTSGGTQNIYISKKIVTGSTTLLTTDFVVFANAVVPITLTLPLAPNDGEVFKIKDVSGNASVKNITINGNGKNIDGSSTILINTDRGGVELCFDTTLNFWSIMNFVG